MLPYIINEFGNQRPSMSSETRPNKVRKQRKCIQRTTRRSLKKDFEKLLVPTFASKLARNFSDNSTNKNQSTRSRKPPKVLPDNLADFIIDNETANAVMSEEDYMRCMEILSNTKNRKNQIMQVCDVLGNCF